MKKLKGYLKVSGSGHDLKLFAVSDCGVEIEIQNSYITKYNLTYDDNYLNDCSGNYFYDSRNRTRIDLDIVCDRVILEHLGSRSEQSSFSSKINISADTVIQENNPPPPSSSIVKMLASDHCSSCGDRWK